MTESTHAPIALVTGGSRGIGAAIAEELSLTHQVIRWSSADVDLADPAAIARAVAALRDPHTGGPLNTLDVLIHSAGVAWEAPLMDTSWQGWEQIYRVNVFGVAELTRLLLPALRAAHGTVVAVNSGSGFHSGAGMSQYSGTKFALRALTDALRAEERGVVRVTSIHPGRTDTDMQVALQSSRGNTTYDATRYVRPESIAAAVRLAVDATSEAMVEEISVRPVAG